MRGQSVNYDLHIHSCLSPCGDGDMTPANIVGMAKLKELDVIAVTDHNSCKNCPAVMKLAKEYEILAIPGMELTTMEEVHVVCLFPDIDKAMAFDELVYSRILPIQNQEDVFGKQQIYNEKDECVGTVPYLLINATDISFDAVYDLVMDYNGIMVPAHIDKKANSLLANLGFVPPDSKFTCVEMKDMKNLHPIQKENPYIEKCKVITNSDAHYLEHINEPVHSLYVKDLNIQEVLKSLN